jgi:clathrin heavy chain
MRACEKALFWDEAVFLFKEDEQYDSAVKMMIAHATVFGYDFFLDCV